MTVLISGGCGFIGSNLANRLVKDSDQHIFMIDNCSLGNAFNVRHVPEDRRTWKRWTDIDTRLPTVDLNIDIIYHLGMASSSPMYKQNHYLISETVENMIRILEYARKYNCKVVYASTSNVYNGNAIPWKENMPVHITDFYTEARYYVERLADIYNEFYGVKSVGLRPFSVYGPNEDFKGEYADLIRQFLWNLRADRQSVIYGDGEQTRDCTHVNDVVEVFLLPGKYDEKKFSTVQCRYRTVLLTKYYL